MSNKRRDLLKAGAGLAASATLPMIWAKNAHAQWNSQPEKGAKLRVLRWSRFVQGDIDQYMKNVQAFTAKYGIEVRVDSESWEDVRPKAAVEIGRASCRERVEMSVADVRLVINDETRGCAWDGGGCSV